MALWGWAFGPTVGTLPGIPVSLPECQGLRTCSSSSPASGHALKGSRRWSKCLGPCHTHRRLRPSQTEFLASAWSLLGPAPAAAFGKWTSGQNIDHCVGSELADRTSMYVCLSDFQINIFLNNKNLKWWLCGSGPLLTSLTSFNITYPCSADTHFVESLSSTA